MTGNSNGEPDQPKAPYVLNKEEGEKRLLGPRAASVIIKASRETGAGKLTALLERIGPGDAIPVHRHEKEEELIFIHTGEGKITLGERDIRVAAGSVALVPQGTWHGVRNACDQEDLIMLAVFSPVGVEGYFRDFSVAPGERWTGMSPQEQEKLEKRYGVDYRGSS